MVDLNNTDALKSRALRRTSSNDLFKIDPTTIDGEPVSSWKGSWLTITPCHNGHSSCGMGRSAIPPEMLPMNPIAFFADKKGLHVSLRPCMRSIR